ncbi:MULTISPECIES: hypothetical protein [unclassified Marinobacter]|uniref:hypothetical protein n=1 Tax=unclassified Marinobacter TaxID=83889 RepID=UPI001268FFB9|nr:MULTISPECIES: hypothetical protein [unclassified Marinobacter]QFS86642.1 hypothetical protein FIV08_07320 [Marinobacter sp. THAF197a]QFT50426.1 hypothetical protein FIU96_07250 [Marinobacter sp. THAF39]QFT52948.1 hypothetical protein FIU96_20055 [Marinobacter sp. THAF39]
MALPLAPAALALGKRIPWKYVGVAAVVAGVGFYVYHLKLTVANLQTTVAEQETTIARKDSEIVGLKGSVVSQNNAVEQWRLIAQAKQNQAADALREAEEQSARADRMIERLQTSGAKTCEEGINLIDEALGL